MKIKVSKAEYDALPESVKAKFAAEGDVYVLQEEDVEGLKKSKADILAENKALKEKFGDLDPEAAKAAIDAAKKAENEKLEASGQFETLKKQLEERHATELATAKKETADLLGTLKKAELKNLLTSRGVMPDRLRAAIAEGDFDNLFELESADGGFQLKKKGGVGDATEMDAIFTDFKTKSPYLFAANDASGSGASGSQGTGGVDLSGKTPEQLLDMANSQTK